MTPEDKDTDIEDKERDALDPDDVGKSETELEATDKDGSTSDAEENAGDVETDPSKVINGLKKRIAKLTSAKNEGRAAQAERDALKVRLEAYERKERNAQAKIEAEERKKPEWQEAERERAAVRAAIDRAYGPGTSELLEEQRDERVLQKEQYALNAVTYLKTELEAHGLATDDKSVMRWERAIGSEIAEDTDLLGRFRRPASLQSAIKDAFTLVNEGLVSPAAQSTGGKAIERIERNKNAVLGGGRGGSNGGAPDIEWNPQPPKNLKGEQLEDWWKEQGTRLRMKLEAEQL